MTEAEEMRKYAEAHGIEENNHTCYLCGDAAFIRKYIDGTLRFLCDKCNYERELKIEAHGVTDYPQAHEPNEYRYLSPAWLDEIAKGLTAGAQKYPGETWRQIPPKEHAWRAVRHLILYLKGDTQDTHLINASMRCMMAFVTADRETWEKLMKEKGCG